MLIFMGILTSLIVCAVVDNLAQARSAAKSDEQWLAHNRALMQQHERSRSGVGQWRS